MATDATVIPHSRESEEATVGVVLIDPEAYYDLARFLDPEDFYIHRHRYIWQAYERLAQKRTPIDLLTVSEELERTGQLAEVGGSAYLTGLVNQVPTSLNAESYGRIVESHAIRRRAITAANNIATAAYDEGKDIENVRSVTQRETAKIYEAKEDRLTTIGQAASESYDRLDEIAKTGQPPSIATGFYDCDKLLHGLHEDELILVATRPGKGKTCFLSDVAAYAASQGSKPKHVLFHSLEMNRVQVVNRMIAALENLSANDIRDGLLKENEWPLFTHSIEMMQEWTLYIDDTPSITPEQIFLSARRLKNQGKLDMLVVDYVQIMGSSEEWGYQKNRNREQEVSHAARRLKHIARELKIPVLAAAQVNREVESRADRRLILSDLRESGSLEQEADIVMFIQPGDDDYSDRREVTLEVAKNRNGPVGEFKLLFLSKSTAFKNLANTPTQRQWWE